MSDPEASKVGKEDISGNSIFQIVTAKRQLRKQNFLG